MGSFFERKALSINKILHIIYSFAHGMSSIVTSREHGTSKTAVLDIYRQLRELVAKHDHG